MKIRKLLSDDPIPKKGDLLLVEGPISGVNAYTVKQVKIVDENHEIILNVRKNTWFNFELYLAGESWVKDCRIVMTK